MPPAAPAEPGDHLRSRAIEAMTAAVAVNGYPGTTVADVLDRAGMSRRTFYRLFANLEECFLAAYDAVADEALALVPPSTPNGSWNAHVEGSLTGLLRYFAANPDRARLFAVEPLAAGPPGLERHERTMRVLARRLGRSHPQPRPELRFEAAVGAVHRVVHARVVDGRTRQLPRLAPQLTRVLAQIADSR